MIHVICKDNEGFSDQLRKDTIYKALVFNTQSVMIENDKGEIKWYGWPKFEPKTKV